MEMRFTLEWLWSGGEVDPPEDVKNECEKIVLKAYNIWAEQSDCAVKKANDFCAQNYGTTDANDPRVHATHLKIWDEEVKKIFSSDRVLNCLVEFGIEPIDLSFVAFFKTFPLEWNNTVSFLLKPLSVKGG